ncbi:MAG TPA: glycosyltransferase family A protein [Thermoleophilaceae bacterium]
MTVSVIVPAWNAEATLGRTLGALARQRYCGSYEVIVVDNGSADRTAALAAAAPGPVRLLRREHGFAGDARNDGVAASSGGPLAFTDADCFPEPGWLAAGVRALERADLVQGRVRPDPQARMGPFDRSLWVSAHDGLYQTASLFMTRSAFDAAGGFEELDGDPDGRAFGEDVWLAWRARRSGARAAFCPEAVVNHAVLPRGAAGYVRDRRGAAGFPLLARRVPELRRGALFGRVFLSRRSAEFDLALAGAAAALVRRRPLALAAAAPYARTIARRALESGARAPLVAPVEVAADALTLGVLARASLRARSPVL